METSEMLYLRYLLLQVYYLLYLFISTNLVIISKAGWLVDSLDQNHPVWTIILWRCTEIGSFRFEIEWFAKYHNDLVCRVLSNPTPSVPACLGDPHFLLLHLHFICNLTKKKKKNAGEYVLFYPKGTHPPGKKSFTNHHIYINGRSGRPKFLEMLL